MTGRRQEEAAINMSGQRTSCAARSSRALLLGVSLLSSCLFAGACVPAEHPDATTDPSLPPVVLISFDTCRADVFGSLSGEEPSLTPRLDELAADAVVFDNAFVQAPHTLPSHMSLLTSLYPDAHGVKPGEGPLPPSVPTLAELLARAGYHTVGLVTSEWLKPDFGFGRGFVDYELLPHQPTYAGRVNGTALARLSGHRGEAEPVFLFLHYYDLHSDFDHGRMRNKLPYYSPPEHRRDLDVSEDGSEFCDAEGNCNTRYLIAMDRERRQLPEREIATIRALYRSAVPHLDAQMGDFFDELKRRGLYDPALIVVTSDHGEEFREHGRFIHSQPYDETIRVPLFVKLPDSRRAGTRVTEVVETVDVMPTILDVLGLPVPDLAQGESALELVAGAARPDDDAVTSQDTINLSRYGLRTTGVKLIMDLATGRRELYDVQRDPRELIDLAGERGELADDMEERLKRLIRHNRAVAARLSAGTAAGEDGELLSTEDRERLEALGYVD